MSAIWDCLPVGIDMYKWLISCGRGSSFPGHIMPSMIRPWSQCTCHSRPKASSPVISGCRGRIAGWFKGKSEISRNPLLDYTSSNMGVSQFPRRFPFLSFWECGLLALREHLKKMPSMLCRQGWAMWCFWKNRCWSSPATTKAGPPRLRHLKGSQWPV